VVLPDLQYFTEISVAASRIFAMIDRIPEIDSEDTLETISGKLNLEHVKSLHVKKVLYLVTTC
jgi:hypothetical protein